MSDRITRADFDRAARRYARAYSAAGMGSADTVGGIRGEGAPADGVFRPTGLDLVFERPTAYTGGGVWISPWHNPLHPARFDGASAHGTPAGLSRFGGTLREAVAMLNTASATLEALTGHYGAHAASEHPADLEAVAYFDAQRDAESAAFLATLG